MLQKTKKEAGRRPRENSRGSRQNTVDCLSEHSETKKEFVDDLMQMIHLTESVSAEIHGVLDKEKIFNIIKNEFSKSKYVATILLLTDDGWQLQIGTTSLLPKLLRVAERVAGVSVKKYNINLKQGKVYQQIIRNGQTIRIRVSEVMKQLLPQPMATAVSQLMRYEKKFCVLTPLRRHKRTVGIFAVSAPWLSQYFVPSVKNLAQHISTALELAEECAERKRIEEALRESESRYRTLFDNAPVGVGLATIDGQIIEGNKVMLKMAGYSEREVKHVHLGDVYQDPKRRTLLLQKLKEDGFVRGFEAGLKRKDGTVCQARLTVAPFVLDGQEVLLTVAEDITQYSQVEHARKEFVSLASHQLRTPLTTVNWYAEMILGGDIGEVSSEQKRYLERIYQSNRRLIKLVNALLNVSRIDLGLFSVEPTAISISEIADSVLDELSPQIAKRNLKVIRDFHRDLPFALFDPTLTRIIFENLISNAIKYTPQEGKIRVKIRNTAKHLLISVADNGYGIPKSQQSQIYEKLFRADNVKEKDTDGTGLGLYIVKAIVEQSGGKIRFKSVENKGTAFYISFPLEGMREVKGVKKLT